MEKKRPIGVTIFGLVFILSGLLSFLTVLNPKTYIQDFNNGVLTYPMYALAIVIPLASIVCGVFLLRLNSWARRLAIILCIANMILLANFLKLTEKTNEEVEKYYKQQEQHIKTQLKPEYQQQGLAQLKRNLRTGKTATPIIFAVFFVVTIGWNLIIIYYFTRPTVKKQFA